MAVYFQSRSGSASSPELQSGGYSDGADGYDRSKCKFRTIAHVTKSLKYCFKK